MNNKEKIVAAFNELVEHNYIDDVNVQLITRKAQVSRTEFYRHFKDKYDLMNYVYFNEIENKINNAEDKDWKLLTRYCYEFMYQRKAFFIKIAKYKKQNNFLEFLLEYSIKKNVEAICKSRNIEKLSSDIYLSMELYCAGCCHMLGKWLENGLKKSPEEMSRIICDSVPENLKPYLDNLKLC